MLHINLFLRAQGHISTYAGCIIKKDHQISCIVGDLFPVCCWYTAKARNLQPSSQSFSKNVQYKVTSSLIFTNLIKPTGLMQLSEICTAPKQYRVPNVHQLLTGYSPRTVQSRTVVLQLINSFTNSFCVRIFTGFFVKFLSSGPGLHSLSLVIVVEMQRAMWIRDNETTSSDFTSTQKWRQSMSN